MPSFCFCYLLLLSYREREPRAFIARELATTAGGAATKEMGSPFLFLLPLPLYLVFCFAEYFLVLCDRVMVVEDTSEGIVSILDEDNLVKIQKNYAIPIFIMLEVLGPSERMTMGSVTHEALYEDVLIARLRFLIPAIVVELLH